MVSNKTGAVLRREAEHLGWTGVFRPRGRRRRRRADKPAVAPILLALEGSGIAGAEVWFVGDTALDMECARNAGCLGVLLGGAARSRRTPSPASRRTCILPVARRLPAMSGVVIPIAAANLL